MEITHEKAERIRIRNSGQRITETVKRLKDIAQDQNITHRELAKRLNVSESAVSRWFGGSRTPNAKSLEQMAETLGYRLAIVCKRCNKKVDAKYCYCPNCGVNMHNGMRRITLSSKIYLSE